MHSRYKIIFSISLALTLFFVLPWVSLLEKAGMIKEHVPMVKLRGRLLFLSTSVFFTSLLFFQLNFFEKKKLMPFKNHTRRKTGIIVMNLLLAIIISLILVKIAISIFDVELTAAFFTIYLSRNLGIAFLSMLVVYAYEAVERSKSDRIKLLAIDYEKTETELAMLKTQLNPHFLFNSLNVLTGVIRENPREAIHFVHHLSETFRYTLEKNSTHLAFLRDEFHFLDSYLYMMRRRFGDGLKINIDIQPEQLSRKLPQFALQILIENAIKHNVVSPNKPLMIHILTSCNELTITNNLQVKKQWTQGYGIGLANLKKRYELLGYETVTIDKTEDEFRVKLLLL